MDVRTTCISLPALHADRTSRTFFALPTMASIYSRSISQRSTSTLDHQWDPYQVLNLERDNRCVGWAHTKRRKCLQTVNHRDKSIFHDILSDISSQPLDAVALRPELRELASHGLCLQSRHRGSQVDSMVDKWTRSINTATRLAQEQARWLQPLLRSGSTAESIATSSPSTPTRRTTRSSSSTMSTSTFAQTEVECLRLSLAAMQATIEDTLRRIEQIESPQAPRIEPTRSLDRVSTTDISSVHLSTPSLTALSTRSSLPRTSTRSPSPARSTSSRHSAASTSTSDSIPPSTPSTQLHHRTQPANRTPTSFVQRIDTRNLSTPPASQSRTEPDTPSTPVSHSATPSCTLTHVRRLPLDPTSSCPICYEPMTASTSSSTNAFNTNSPSVDAHIDTDTVWCKAGCGQSVHTSCMDAWRASCAVLYTGRGAEVRCTMCRTRWEGDCAC